MGIGKRSMAIAACSAIMLTAPLMSHAATLVVDENNTQGWTVTVPPAGWTSQPALGPGTPLQGQGSWNFKNTDPSVGGSTVALRTAVLNSRQLSDLVSVSYTTYSAPGSSSAPWLFMSIDHDADTTTSNQTLYFEPAYQAGTAGGNQGPLTTGQWQTWTFTPTVGGFGQNSIKLGSRNGDVFTLAEMLVLLETPHDTATPPNPRAVVSPNARFGTTGNAFSIFQGLNAGGTHDNYVDSVRFVFNANEGLGQAALDVTYNFETVNVPEPASLALLGAGGLLMLRRRTAR